MEENVKYKMKQSYYVVVRSVCNRSKYSRLGKGKGGTELCAKFC